MTETPPFVDRYAEVQPRLGGPGWLTDLRRTGLERYHSLGLPTARAEAWKYTSLSTPRKIAFVPAALAAAPSFDSLPGAGIALTGEACRFVMVNGRFVPSLSSLDDLPPEVEVLSVAEVLQNDPGSLEPFADHLYPDDSQPLANLNAAYLEDGVLVRIAAGAVLQRPLHIVSIQAAGATPLMCHPRLLIIAEAGCNAAVVESRLGFGGGPTLCNVVTDVLVGEEAALGHYVLQNGSDDNTLIGSTRVDVQAGGSYESFALHVGGALARNEVRVLLGGEGASCQINGAYAVTGTEHVDNTVLVDHAVPQTVSRQTFKGVLDGHGRGVFQGKILVRRHAQQTDGQQMHKALLLSRGAEVDCKPELEIYADDVKCGHGATAGELDEDAMFFLRARGLDPETARGLLIEAFLDDVIEQITHVTVREVFKGVVAGWLARR